MAPVDFSGSWKQDRAENLEAWLKVMDFNVVMRTAMSTVSPTHHIQQDGDSFTVKISGPMGKSHEQAFTVGQEHKSELPNGKKITGMPKWEGERLVIEATLEEDPSTPLVSTREMVGEEMVFSTTRKGVTCKRFFKKN